MMYLLIAIAAAMPPTWLNPGYGGKMSDQLSDETKNLLVAQCTAPDLTPTGLQAGGAALVGWLNQQTDPQNVQSPTKDQALKYCNTWATSMGGAGVEGNFVVAPMSQLAITCGMYHCLENFFGFAPADMTNVECVMQNMMTSFVSAGFPESTGGADMQDYSMSACACNSELAAAAPSPTYPEWLTHTGTVRVCANHLQWDPTNAPFWACSLRACMPKGAMKDYLICTQDTYYGFEGLDECEKLDKLIIGNLAAPVPLAITGVVFFFLAMTLYGIISLCCGSKKNKEAKIGV